MAVIDVAALADQIADAHVKVGTSMAQPSVVIPGFDLQTAYAVERELMRRRIATGARPVGRKVGYANKAVWRALKLDTVTWAHMYDGGVIRAVHNQGTVSIATMHAPKIEPEIVFKLASPVPETASEPAEILQSVEWIALGCEIIDCVYPDWKFQPQDFVASYGLHAALVVGEPKRLASGDLVSLAEQLARFTVRLERDGQVVAEGSGRNVLRNPALSVGELAKSTARQLDTEPLGVGELVSSGTLTESQFIGAGQTWTATVDGLDLPSLSVRVR